MKKSYLVLVLLALLMFACKKSTNSSGGKSTPTYDATVSYTASAQTLHWFDSAQQYVIDSVLGSTACALINFPKISDTLFSGPIYEFPHGFGCRLRRGNTT